MTTYEYTTKGTCSKLMQVTLDGRTIKDVKIVGGCPGNTVGVSKLAVGRDVEEVIGELRGIPCGNRGTSCPDQLSYALEQAYAQEQTAK